MPKVTILMAVYNGARDLRAQLDSFAAQDHHDWTLVASDDGSRDETRAILEAFAAEGHEVTILSGPCKGAAANFMSLLRWADENLPADRWLACSDQDDVWLPDRLSRGVAALEAAPSGQPALFCSRTWITDEALQGKRLSVPRPRPLGFRNALVQNVVAGNTILLDAAAARLVTAAAQEAGRVVVHDWWIYQIVSGAGGTLVHDDRPTLYYRQHAQNEIGANDSLGARMRRARMLLAGHFREWNEINIAALKPSRHRFTPANARLFDAFAGLREAPLRQRLATLRRLRLYRQTRISTAALWFSAIFDLL